MFRGVGGGEMAVSAPTMQYNMDFGASTNSAFERATMYTPAVTMVARE